MKRGNKGQSANEAALLVIFLTFLMIITIAAVSDDIIRASDNNYRALLHDIADVIESEASIAFASENGYTHSFTLPQTLNGQPYAISIMNSTQVGDQANMTILSVASTRPNVHLNVTRLLPRDVLGTLVIGPNIVRKEQGIVTLMALPLPPPVVSSVSPSSGSTLGGTSVAISGSDFLNTPTAPTVTFGGVSGSVTSSTSNTINVVTPAHAAGAVNVVVTNPDGQFYTLVNGFTYVPPPSITSITPNSGSTVGGTPITITGDYFQSGLSVTIGTSVATDVVVSPDGKTITATTSSSLTAGAKDVTVTNPDGQFSILPSAFTYVFPPSVTSITPNSGSTVGGTPITITGDYFQSGLSVTIGTSVATDVVVSPDGKTITAKTSPSATAGAKDVTVTNPDGQFSILPGAFTYVAPPSIASVSPPNGPAAGGTAVVISGSDFGATVSVSFGGAPGSVSSSTSDTINVVTPAHAAGLVDVVVTNPDGQFSTLVNGFTYEPLSVTSVSPVSGPTAGSTSVTITGSYFVSGAGVTFGGAAAGSVTFVSSTQLTAVTPAHAAGLVDVVVTNPDGQSGTLVNGFTYVAPPSIASVTPNSGSTVGGTAVVISGSDFGATPSVTFGGAAASVSSSTSDTINVVTPAHAAGAVNVVVTNPDGQFSTLVNGFTYFPPSITSVSPVSGPTAGGTVVTITGSYFVSGAGVTFGGAAAGSVTFVSSTQLTAVTPAHAAGLVDVVVTNPDGQSGTLVNGFTYVAPPTVSSFNPRIGPYTGDTSVTVTGSNFVSGAIVTFGGVAGSVTFVSSTELTAVTPASAVGYVTVRVINPDGQSANAPYQFLYRISPVPIGTVFVTPAPSSGNLRGLTGADNRCQFYANGGGFGGTWKAWLSTSTVNANTRITDATYRRLDNVIVANSMADLTDGSIANRINVSSDGSMLGFQYVWTGTTAAGVYPGGSSTTYSCSDWASSSSSHSGIGGFTSYTTSSWTYGSRLTCNSLERLYCFKTS